MANLALAGEQLKDITRAINQATDSEGNLQPARAKLLMFHILRQSRFLSAIRVPVVQEAGEFCTPFMVGHKEFREATTTVTPRTFTARFLAPMYGVPFKVSIPQLISAQLTHGITEWIDKDHTLSPSGIWYISAPVAFVMPVVTSKMRLSVCLEHDFTEVDSFRFDLTVPCGFNILGQE